MKEQVICFGEMLWDMLPSGKQAGGAPMNVAIHLKNFGLPPLMISRVGSDDLGVELIQFLKNEGISTELVQVGNTHLTGVVKVNLDDKNEVTYKIVQPVAWDYIQLDENLIQKVKEADIFIFGSLATRSNQSRETLYELLKIAKTKIFDVNIRPPHYSQEGIEYLLNASDIVKMNHHELAEVAAWYEIEGDEEVKIKSLYQKFNLDILCVTLGADGAAVLSKEGYFTQHGYKVEVQDTIGSGDSFLAAFISNILKGTPIQEALKIACAVGALVATHRGATPRISDEEIAQIINQ